MAQKVPIFNDPVQLEVRNHVIKLESDEIIRSRRDIENLDKDINTTRRQVEIIQDISLRKSNSIFLLKTSLTYLCLILIPLLLTVKQYISWKGFSYFAIGLTILFGIVVYFNIRSVLSRDANRYSSREFTTSSQPVAQPMKCVKKLTPQQKELEQQMKKLNSLDAKLKLVEQQQSNIVSKRNKLGFESKQLETQYKSQFPNDKLDTEIEKKLSMRNRL
jgi:hypothetical protein